MNSEFPSNSIVDYLNEHYLWFNPGFLKDVDSLNDVTTSEIFSSLKPSTNSFTRLINELKTKTIYDSQVDFYFNSYPDWP